MRAGVKETGTVGSFPRCFFSFDSEKVDCAAGGVSYPGTEEGGKDPPSCRDTGCTISKAEIDKKSSAFLLQDPCTSCTTLKAEMSKVSQVSVTELLRVPF